MRTKTNVASLGEALLLIHYSPYKNEHFERRTDVHREEVDIYRMTELDGQKRNSLEL